jgi:hypothetical protein
MCSVQMNEPGLLLHVTSLRRLPIPVALYLYTAQHVDPHPADHGRPVGPVTEQVG